MEDAVSSVLDRERAFWNARYDSFEQHPLDHSEETFRGDITPAFERGGTHGGLVHRRALDIVMGAGVAGRPVLDYCCGRGKWSMKLASLGGVVSGFDISESAITYARSRARHNGFRSEFVVADAGRLPFQEDSFDLVLGISALEHAIKYPRTAEELLRVLRPDGIAVFTENLGGNPAVNAARKITMRGEEDAGDVLLTHRHVRDWAARFSSVTIEGYSFFFMAKRVLSNRTPVGRAVLRALYAFDEGVFRLSPGLRRYGGECVIVLRP